MWSRALLKADRLDGVRASVTYTPTLGRGVRRALKKLRRDSWRKTVLLSSPTSPAKNPIIGSQRGGGSEGHGRMPVLGNLDDTCTRGEMGEGEKEVERAAASRTASGGTAARRRSGRTRARILRTRWRSVVSPAGRARGARTTHVSIVFRNWMLMKRLAADLWTTTGGVWSGLAAHTLVCRTLCQDLWRGALGQRSRTRGPRARERPASRAQGTGSDGAHVSRRRRPGSLDGRGREHPARLGGCSSFQLRRRHLHPRR